MSIYQFFVAVLLFISAFLVRISPANAQYHHHHHHHHHHQYPQQAWFTGMTQCYAQTTCLSPVYGAYSISCSVQARPYPMQPCYYFAVPGREVRCMGFDIYWNWVNLLAYCR